MRWGFLSCKGTTKSSLRADFLQFSRHHGRSPPQHAIMHGPTWHRRFAPANGHGVGGPGLALRRQPTQRYCHHFLHFVSFQHEGGWAVNNRHKGLHIKVTRWDVQRRERPDDVVVCQLHANLLHAFTTCRARQISLVCSFFCAARKGPLATVRLPILGPAHEEHDPSPLRIPPHQADHPCPPSRLDAFRQVWRTTRRAGESLRFPSGPDLGLEGLTQFGLERFEIGGVHPCKGSPWSVTLCHEGPCARCRSAFPSCECRG